MMGKLRCLLGHQMSNEELQRRLITVVVLFVVGGLFVFLGWSNEAPLIFAMAGCFAFLTLLRLVFARKVARPDNDD